MKMQLIVRQERGVSFTRDPEALGLLLYEILEMADQSGGEVLVKEAYGAAHQLGYRGSPSGFRRLLIARGFVCEVEKHQRFFLQEMNREAIQQFLKTHQELFAGKHLDEYERSLLFSSVTNGGTEADMLLVWVMKSLSTLLEGLQKLSLLESKVRTHTALSEINHFLALDRVRWYHEQVKQLQCRVEGLENNPSSQVWHRQYPLDSQREEMFGKFASAVSDASREREAFMQNIHDSEVVAFLKSVREAILHLDEVFVRKEGELHQ
jgi:hypothetical protein